MVKGFTSPAAVICFISLSWKICTIQFIWSTHRRKEDIFLLEKFNPYHGKSFPLINYNHMKNISEIY